MKKRALITGITGQDGYYLSDFLLNKGYEVFGYCRKRNQLSSDYKNIKFIFGLLNDKNQIKRIINEVKPCEIYNLAAITNNEEIYKNIEYTCDINGMGALRILEAICEVDKNIKFFHASTSEIFGNSFETMQNEKTNFSPRTPYGISKAISHYCTAYFREYKKIFACNGILYNHESPRRSQKFVANYIATNIVKIWKNEIEYFNIGNLDAKRDWGFAGDYVEAIWLMMQKDIPDDYIIATGIVHSVRYFIEKAFEIVGISIEWIGEGVNECGVNINNGKVVVRVEEALMRNEKNIILCGNNRKARKSLGWSPEMNFDTLVSTLVKHVIQSTKET